SGRQTHCDGSDARPVPVWAGPAAGRRRPRTDCTEKRVVITPGSHAFAELSAPCRALLLFHDTLQGVLMLAGKIHHLRHLRFGDLVGEHTALPDTVVMH